MISLVSIPVANISLLPLSLPPANGINNGGYKWPCNSSDGYSHEYSPIDLLVAGIEALRRNIVITSLVSFFDKNREGCESESEVYVTLLDDRIYTYPVAQIKQKCKLDQDLYKLMLRNAPLTFKWR